MDAFFGYAGRGEWWVWVGGERERVGFLERSWGNSLFWEFREFEGGRKYMRFGLKFSRI